LLSPPGKRTDTSQLENILNWMENSSIAERVLTVKQSELSQWGMNPPRAYFELVFPDRTEKILVGKERDGLIYIYQPQRKAVLGYKKENIVEILKSDFEIHKLLFEDEPPRFSKIEIIYPGEKTISLVKLDNYYWAVNGIPEKKFRMEKISWVISPFVSWHYVDYINDKPYDLKSYGLQKPRAKLRYYSGDNLYKEFWVGDWDFKQKRCYVYVPVDNIVVFYSQDIMTQIPRDAGVFLREKN
jgi:hypothetical protein